MADDHAELERILTAVGQAALADTLAGMWAQVLGIRTVLVAAGEAPNANGLEVFAQRLWTAAVERWAKPVATWAWHKQGASGGVQEDRNWEKLSVRMSWTIDLVVKAITNTVNSKLSPDQLRSQVADVLSLDAFTTSLLDEIHDLEQELLDPERSRTDTDAAFARRVRLQSNVFMLNAARTRSKGFAALASVDPEHADDWRRLARESMRPADDVRKADRELARHDERLFHNPAMDPGKLARLQAKLVKLNGEGRNGQETWRNSITRDARAVATGLLNSSTLQYGIEQSRATGQEWVKTWVATEDARTRPTHAAADGQVQPILEPFTVGTAKLDNPGDFDAPPEEFWNCRCAMTVMSRADHDALMTEGAALAAAATTEEPMTVPEMELSDLPPVMWHGVIMRENTYTGDQRFWRGGSLRTQAMPLPVRFQREEWSGHQGAVVTANMEAARRFGNDIRAWGTFADGTLTPEVDEVQGLMATRMIRGTSVDGDDVLDSQFTLELDAEANAFEMYDSMRLRGVTFCAIPAFDGAEVYIGPPPPEWLLEGEPLAVEQNDPGQTRPLDAISDNELEAMLAASRVPENLAEYWTTGEGAAKIRWGAPGDFNRCREQLAKYVNPGQLSGMCANLHHRALGVWPGREAATPYLLTAALATMDDVTVGDIEAAWKFDRELFMPRELNELTPVTIDDKGNVYGHIAGWKTCHQGYSDMCVTPPHSLTAYALFHTGAVRLADGSDLPIGKLTVGAGHANPNGLGVQGAIAHYDNSATAVAMVRAAEDKHGIQVSGVIIPGTSESKIAELRRSPISGDWRAYQGNLELVAALGVNSPGFPVPRAMIASVDGKQTSLIAAGYVPRDLDAEVTELSARMYEPLVASLAARMEPDPEEVIAKLVARMESPSTEV